MMPLLIIQSIHKESLVGRVLVSTTSDLLLNLPLELPGLLDCEETCLKHLDELKEKSFESLLMFWSSV